MKNFKRKLLVCAAKTKLKPIKTIRKLFGEKKNLKTAYSLAWKKHKNIKYT